MTNNTPDYENNLVFSPTSADDLNEQYRQSDVLINTIDKCKKLEQEPIEDDYKLFDYVKDKGIYVGLIYDENGENPKKLFVALEDKSEPMTWYNAMQFEYADGYRVPSLRELTQIWLYKDAINAGLEAAGGEKLKKDDWYWSSTEYNAGIAWLVTFNDGGRYANYKHYTRYVRPVLAF